MTAARNGGDRSFGLIQREHAKGKFVLGSHIPIRST